MGDYLVPLLIIVGFIAMFIIVSYFNHKTKPPQEIEFIDCENCANTKCMIRKQNYLVRKGEQDPNCHYMPHHKM